ncbi:MAG TPA: hypothetical protein PKH51_12355 [Candidatus Sumerlaeota bacterium]|nr:hypothetical protein [Candidatus Sumerlaeota bacterium]
MARPKKVGYSGKIHESVIYVTNKRSESAALCQLFKNIKCSCGDDHYEFDLTGRPEIRKYIESGEFAKRAADFDSILSFLAADGAVAGGGKRRGRKPGSGKKEADAKAPKAGKKRRRRRTGAELAEAKRELAIRKAVTKRLKLNRPGKRSPEDAARLEAEIKKELAKK